MKNTTKVDNNSKKILVIGANGFLGTNLLKMRFNPILIDQNLVLIAASLHNTQIDTNVPFVFIDITNFRNTLKKIIKISPDFIILTAAMTNVDQCEINKKLASKLNTEGAINVLKACEKTNTKLIFLSSDFVFDGTKEDEPYNEKDIPNPLNHYGKTKYEAEMAIINSDIEFIICRTAVLYGWDKSKLNFITWILKNLEQNKQISIVTDQINSPTFARNLAEILLKLVEKRVNGIYHTAGDCILNRYEMALQCAEIFNHQKDLIYPIKNLKQKAIRPRNVGLKITKLKRLIGSDVHIYSLEDGLKEMKSNRVIQNN